MKTTSIVSAAALLFISTVVQGADRRLLYNIQRVGESKGMKIPVYSYQYNPAIDLGKGNNNLVNEDNTFFGAIAQDLLETHPKAVKRGKNGYYKIDYSQIDVDFRIIEGELPKEGECI